jgi:integrase/recombinase XerD
MEMSSLAGITAPPIIDTRRAKATPVSDNTKSKVDEKYPVKFRVTFMRKQVYYSSGIDLTLREWEFMPETRLFRGMKNSIIGAFNDKIYMLIKNSQIGTAEYYQNTLNNIRLFITKDPTFSEITPDWLQRYEINLIDRGKSYTTVGMHMRAIRSIINEGMEVGVIAQTQYPFGEGKGKYQIPVSRQKDGVNGEIRFYRQKTIKTKSQKREIAAIFLPELQ